MAPLSSARLNFVVSTLLAFTGLIGRSIASPIPGDRFYPREAHLVTVADRAQLQTRLDLHGVIRLEPGNYQTGNPLPKLVVRSNQRIYGLGSITPTIEINPGTSGAVISSIHGTLLFPPSDTPTTQNRFQHITYSSIKVNGGVLIDNLFLDTGFSSWDVDHRTSGFWRNNRLIRSMSHSASTPTINVRGRVASQPNSYGNVLVWMNSLSSSNEIVNIERQRDFNLIFTDCEAYAQNNATAVTVRDVDQMSLFGTYGSMRTGGTIDQGAKTFWLHGHELGTYTPPNTVQRASNETSVITNFSNDMQVPVNESNPAANRFRLYNTFADPAKVKLLNETPLLPPASAESQSAFMKAVATSRTAPAWERPTFSPIPNPAGPNWQASRVGQPSSRSAIQSDLDADGIAFLDAGIYYLDAPIVLRKDQRLIGSGADRTALVALNSTIDLIASDTVGGSIAFTLADLTLQGGRSGIHHTVNNGQFSGMTLSHVTIRDMSDSGIWLENIYAWDNNPIHYLNILNCPSGIKQRAPVSGGDADPLLTYLDKNVFYQCQFVACQKALDLIGGRASNGNCWVNCRFEDNTTYAALMRSHNTAIFANCDFINNAGHPVVNVQGQLYMVNCAFDDASSGAIDYVDGIAISLEGCTFKRQPGSNVVISAPNPTWIDLTNPANRTSYRNHNSYFFNCWSTNVPIQVFFAGIIANSWFPDRADLSVNAVLVSNEGATVTPLVSGVVAPASIRPQLMIGSRVPAALSSEMPGSVPSITSPNAAYGIVGRPFSYSITADQLPSVFTAISLPGWLTLDPITGVLSGSPTTVGNVVFEVGATNFLGESSKVPVTLTVGRGPTAGYDSYRAIFGAASGETRADAWADFDGDGVSNLMEYAFRTDATNPSSLTVTRGVPPISVSGVAKGGIEIRLRDDDSALRYEIENSRNLVLWEKASVSFNGGSWSSSNPSLLLIRSQQDQGGHTWRLEIEDPRPLESGMSLFLRAALTLAPAPAP